MSKENYVAVGGQALMEGIMMRGPKGTAMSCRMPDGSIETEMKDFVSVRKKYKILNIPFIRGIVSFVESMILGYKLLMESAEKTTLDMENTQSESKLDKWLEDHFGPKMMAAIGFIGTVLGILLAFFLFMWLPSRIYDLINDYVFKAADISRVRALIEGIIRIIIFVLYMFITSKMKEIHRVYMYHGAEHKTIFCFEHGNELTVENVLKEKRFHPRCGTSFIFVTILLSILISSIVAIAFPGIATVRWLWIIAKISLLPLIMGIGFEFIQLAGKYPNSFTKLLSAPGLAMQRITTAEPDAAIAEVAIAAMKAALTGEVPEEEMPKKKDDAEEESADAPADEEQSEEAPQETVTEDDTVTGE
ncbi:MAG: DUF1385 domain-containing protein [Clostridia bacterium]|nr:DUF1385 domain-containing protein [Clostridia bacterium]